MNDHDRTPGFDLRYTGSRQQLMRLRVHEFSKVGYHVVFPRHIAVYRIGCGGKHKNKQGGKLRVKILEQRQRNKDRNQQDSADGYFIRRIQFYLPPNHTPPPCGRVP